MVFIEATTMKTVEEFKALANDYGVDTYGDIFSECGWGVCFAFDLAEALFFYLPENWNGQDSDEYKAYCALGQAPILYNNPYGGVEEESTAESLFKDMEADPTLWRKLFDALLFYSLESDKYTLEQGRKENN